MPARKGPPGGPGEPAGGLTPPDPEGPTTAGQIADLTDHIAKLGAELEDARRTGVEARETRQRVAFDASRGDVAAVKALAGATETSARSAVDVENVQLAIEGARDRLKALEERAEGERLARERGEALAVCDRRAEAARRVDAALRELWEASSAWRATTPELEAYREQGQRWIPGDIRCEPWAMRFAVGAVSAGLQEMLGMRFGDPREACPLAEADPALLWAGKERGEDVETLSLSDPDHPRWRRSGAPPAAPDDDEEDDLGEAA